MWSRVKQCDMLIFYLQMIKTCNKSWQETISHTNIFPLSKHVSNDCGANTWKKSLVAHAVAVDIIPTMSHVNSVSRIEFCYHITIAMTYSSSLWSWSTTSCPLNDTMGGICQPSINNIVNIHQPCCLQRFLRIQSYFQMFLSLDSQGWIYTLGPVTQIPTYWPAPHYF